MEGSQSAVAGRINLLTEEKEKEGYKSAVIATDERKKFYKCKIIKSIGSRKNEASIAAGLYDILREMDNLGVQYIYSESFDNDILGGAVMNRMIKAAAYHIVQA